MDLNGSAPDKVFGNQKCSNIHSEHFQGVSPCDNSTYFSKVEHRLFVYSGEEDGPLKFRLGFIDGFQKRPLWSLPYLKAKLLFCIDLFI